jgi:hypothetical protein
MARSGSASDIDALKLLLESARGLVAELADTATERAMRALAAVPPDQRSVLATALERAAQTWRQNEAFAALHQVHLRANPHAQLFVRVFDPVEEPPHEEFDLLPEAIRVMRRMGSLMRPELRAVWEPAVTGALVVLTPEERARSIRFLEHALTLVGGRSQVDRPATDENADAGAADAGPAAGRSQRR